MKLGQLTFNNPYILAPLAGYTDLPFRRLCRELGASLCISEMISCHGLVYGQEKTFAMLDTVPEERPVGFQLFGSDPIIMADAAAIMSRYPIDLIDINMGCPVRKVIKKGSGAALMKNFELARDIIQAVSRNTTLPVTVKFRSGWNYESIMAADFGKMAEESGAAMLTIHARTWAQGFGGQADWKIIAEVKDSVSIPVIGNGDILSYEDGQRMIEQTGCDGVMVGRGALGNPWVFQKKGRPQTYRERLPAILRHLELISIHLPGEKMLFRIKNHISRYLTGLTGASSLREQITQCPTLELLKKLLHEQSG